MPWLGAKVSIVKRIGVGRRAGVALVRLGPDPVRLSNPATRFRCLLIDNRQILNNESPGSFTRITILTPLPEFLIQSEFSGGANRINGRHEQGGLRFRAVCACINEHQ